MPLSLPASVVTPLMTALAAAQDAALAPLHTALVAVAGALDPLAGGAAVPVALVVLTLAARAAMLPLAVRAWRVQRTRLALAPELRRLRERHAGDPARLARETRGAYRAAGVSPVAGLLPALVQAPLLLLLYRLCVVPVVAGGPNAVVGAALAGAPLAERALAVAAAAGVAPVPALVVVALVLALAAVAWASSGQAVRLLRRASPEAPPRPQVVVARLAPFATVAAAAVVPLAVTVHLLATSAWVLVEREVLARTMA